MKMTARFYKWPVFVAMSGIFILILFVVVITFITTGRKKLEQSVTLIYEIGTQTMSKKEVEDLVNGYLIPTLKKQVSDRELDFTWQYNETGIQVFTVTDAQTINNLKRLNSVIKLQLPAYVKINELAQRQKSAKKLQRLMDMLVKYAASNNEKYPISFDELKQYDDESLLPWLHENIEYLGKGKTRSDSPDIAIAYDRILFEKGKGTNVLFNDNLVNFVRPNELENLGITAGKR